MKVISSPKTLQKICLSLAGNNKIASNDIAGKKSVGLVATMGALHGGHVSLIKKSVSENAVTVVSIFVNPKQFGRGEDYLKYPRPLKKDLAVCKANKVDYVFVPKPEDMYLGSHSTYVEVLGLSDNLCGAFRPGHFKGVATVIAKLFNITQADNAYFGLKDYQQFKIIQKMTRDLNFKTRVVPCRIVREKDGLAMSSRNAYLSAEDRKKALKISKTLLSADTADIKKIIKKEFRKVDYIEILDADTLAKVSKTTKEILVAAAVWAGKTRLIDNVILKRREKV